MPPRFSLSLLCLPPVTSHSNTHTHTEKQAVQLVAHASRPTQEVFTEMEEKYGEVEEMNVCDNLGDHLVGNVYVKVGDGCEALAASLASTPPLNPSLCVCVRVCSSVARRTQRKRSWT